MEAIYVRQSLDVKDSISIETQIEFSLKRCETAEESVRIYKDKGFSGKNMNRPQFIQMIQDIKAGLVHRVIVYRIDRFSRSILDFANLWEIMSENKVEFLSVNENFDTSTSMGKAMLFIIIVFAQYERETIAGRVRDNYFQRAKNGYWPGGPAPFGLKTGKIVVDGKEVSTLELTEEIEVVKRVFGEYVYPRMSIGKIVKKLNSEGIKGPKNKSWTCEALSRTLRSAVYVMSDINVYLYFKNLGVDVKNDISDFNGISGGLVVGKKDTSTKQRQDISKAKFAIGLWPGVIESNLWLTVQQKLSENVKIGNNGNGIYSWLTGVFKCGYCKRAMAIKYVRRKNGKEYVYAYCSGKYQGTCCDDAPILPLGDIEGYVEDELVKVFETCENVPIEVSADTLKIEQKSLHNELIKIEAEINNCISAIKSGTAVAMKYINQELARLEEKQLKLLEEQNKKCEVTQAQITLDNIDFKQLSFDEKKLVVSLYLEKVYVYKNSIEIEWKV